MKYICGIGAIIIVIFTIILVYRYFHHNKLIFFEHFSNNFLQVYPLTGSSPLYVDFVPWYANDFVPFTVEFGDGTTKYTAKTDAPFSHTYSKGNYKCVVDYGTSVQNFDITSS